MSYGLTEKQAELLCYLTGFLQQRGYGPTQGEMRRAIGIKSISGVVRLLDALQERGKIRRQARRWRTIEVIDPPAPVATAPDGRLMYFVPIGGAS